MGSSGCTISLLQRIKYVADNLKRCIFCIKYAESVLFKKEDPLTYNSNSLATSLLYDIVGFRYPFPDLIDLLKFLLIGKSMNQKTQRTKLKTCLQLYNHLMNKMD